MYPGELLNLFPAFPRKNMVFVAMSFDKAFLTRWKDIIEPAVSEIEVSHQKLSAHRVDLAFKNDSLITEIVKNISECKLFLADISTIGYLPIDSGKNRPIRNANVFYEVGIAHSCRLPEEVILLRSDNDPIDFDIAGVRVHNYDPENIEQSIQTIRKLIERSLKSIDDRRYISVEKAVQTLDVDMYSVLQESIVEIPHPPMRTLGNVVTNSGRISAINHMLRSGLLEAKFKKLTADTFNMPTNEKISYISTPFGRSVLARAQERNNF